LGVWAQTPNPKSPIPNPQSPIELIIYYLKYINLKNNINNNY